MIVVNDGKDLMFYGGVIDVNGEKFSVTKVVDIIWKFNLASRKWSDLGRMLTKQKKPTVFPNIKYYKNYSCH